MFTDASDGEKTSEGRYNFRLGRQLTSADNILDATVTMPIRLTTNVPAARRSHRPSVRVRFAPTSAAAASASGQSLSDARVVPTEDDVCHRVEGSRVTAIVRDELAETGAGETTVVGVDVQATCSWRGQRPPEGATCDVSVLQPFLTVHVVIASPCDGRFWQILPIANRHSTTTASA